MHRKREIEISFETKCNVNFVLKVKKMEFHRLPTEFTSIRWSFYKRKSLFFVSMNQIKTAEKGKPFVTSCFHNLFLSLNLFTPSYVIFISWTMWTIINWTLSLHLKHIRTIWTISVVICNDHRWILLQKSAEFAKCDLICICFGYQPVFDCLSLPDMLA